MQTSGNGPRIMAVLQDATSANPKRFKVSSNNSCNKSPRLREKNPTPSPWHLENLHRLSLLQLVPHPGCWHWSMDNSFGKPKQNICDAPNTQIDSRITCVGVAISTKDFYQQKRNHAEIVTFWNPKPPSFGVKITGFPHDEIHHISVNTTVPKTHVRTRIIATTALMIATTLPANEILWGFGVDTSDDAVDSDRSWTITSHMQSISVTFESTVVSVWKGWQLQPTRREYRNTC